MGSIARQTLLLVEDSDDLSSLIKQLLNDNGFDIEIARGGDEAFEWLKNHSAFLVISDINMPKGNGIDLLKRIRASGSKIPFYLMTGGDNLNKQSALSIGADGFFKKPDGMSTLVLSTVRLFNSLFPELKKSG